MNLWKKIRIIVFIGLGIFTVFINGQENDQTGVSWSQILNAPGVLAGFARTIEAEIESVSLVSNLSVNDVSETIHFTVKTTDGDVFEDFQCSLKISFDKKSSMETIDLVKCGSSVAKFGKDIHISMMKFFNFVQSDLRANLN